MSAPNKRDTDRAQLLGGLRGEVMVYRSVTITQISRAGAQVATRFPLRLDSLHDFRLTLGERFVVVKGRVAYCEIDDADPDLASYRSGVQFIEPSEQVATVIAEFVASIESDEITR